MKILICKADQIGDDVVMELEPALQDRNVRIEIVFDNGASQAIVVNKQELIRALAAL